MTSLAIFGTGRIGGGVAARAASSGLIHNLVLYDSNQSLLEAQRLDIEHMRCPVSVSKDPDDISSCDIVVYTAGLPRNQDIKTRQALLESNLPVAAEFTTFLHDFKGIVIVITNPADILTYYLWKKLGLPRDRVIGFGGQLDGARFQYELDLRSLRPDGIIMGEHGEHQVPIFSHSGQDVDLHTREEILANLRKASMEIIKGKGATDYAPVYHIWELIASIITDSHKQVVCSTIMNGEYGIHDCSIGVPLVIGRDGILSIPEMELDSWELSHLKDAAIYLSDICRRLPAQ